MKGLAIVAVLLSVRAAADPAGSGPRSTRAHEPDAYGQTGFGTVEMAVHAMRRGASDFLLKPFAPRILAEKMREVLAGASR